MILEIQEILKAYFNVFSPGLDHITWQYLKLILANNTCVIYIFCFANICILLQHWPRHFKKLVYVIILKLSKPSYNTSKAFRPIILLNMLGKLIKKMIARQLQFDDVKYSILHSNQLEDVI